MIPLPSFAPDDYEIAENFKVGDIKTLDDAERAVATLMGQLDLLHAGIVELRHNPALDEREADFERSDIMGAIRLKTVALEFVRTRERKLRKRVRNGARDATKFVIYGMLRDYEPEAYARLVRRFNVEREHLPPVPLLAAQGPRQLDYAGEQMPIGETRDPQALEDHICSACHQVHGVCDCGPEAFG